MWELWRRLSLAVLSECCWWWLCSHWAYTAPLGHHHTGAIWGLSYTSVKPGLVLRFKEEAVSYQSRQQALWGSADLWKLLADHLYYYQVFRMAHVLLFFPLQERQLLPQDTIESSAPSISLHTAFVCESAINMQKIAFELEETMLVTSFLFCGEIF